MPKLHQILAVEADVRNQTRKDLTTAHHGLKKLDMLAGVQRTYQPVKEDGDKLGAEGNLLQVRVPEVIRKTSSVLSRMFNIVATRDFGNQFAKADVVIEGKVLLKDAPAIYLLWLEKQLVDLHTFICGLPLLPADTEWIWDGNQNCYRNAREIKTHRQIKVEDFRVVVQATEQHPAQVSKLVKDETAGHWTTIKYSGAVKVEDAEGMKARIENLMKEVKFAREKANQVEAEDKKVADPILKFVFGDVLK